MKAPFFSVVLPTKGRSFLVGHAIRSVLAQTCSDFELVVADNDDGDATRQVVECFTDPRLRYVRTGGLNMNDNWERAAEAATGEYLLMIEDKQMLKRTALAQLATHIARLQPEVLRWSWDEFEDQEPPARVRRSKGDGTVNMIESDTLLAGFLTDIDKDYRCTLPIPHLACLRRSVLARVQAGPFGRIFPPVSLDVMLGLLLLNEVDAVCVINAPLVLFTTNIHSNGASIARKGKTGQQFLSQLPGGVSDTYCHVPIKCVNTPSSIYNDFMRARAMVGGRLLRHHVHWPKYFVEAYGWLIGPVLAGVDMSAELLEWERALADQPAEVQRSVHSILAARHLAVPSAFAKKRRDWARALRFPQSVRWAKHFYRGRLMKNPEWRFSDPVAYYEWDCAQAGFAPE